MKLSTRLIVLVVVLQAVMFILLAMNNAFQSMQYSEEIFTGALMGVVITLSLTAAITYSMTANLRKLEIAAKAMSIDQLEFKVELEGKGELDDLTGTFNRLAQELSEAKKALRKEHEALERESRFMQALLDGIDAVVMEARLPGYQFTFVSREAKNLLGYAVSDWLKPNFWVDNIQKEDVIWLKETILGHTEKGESFTIDFRMSHQQGHTIWVRAINSVEFDEDQRPIIRGLILDITEQKTAEDRIV